MRQIRFVDTTIRDGQASLWAMNMRTSHILPIMKNLDSAGFEGIEFIAPGSRLKKHVRHLRENPFDWIRAGAAAVQHSELRWHGNIAGGGLSGHVPLEIGELLVKVAVELGIRYVRTGNNWNDYEAVRQEKERYERLGMTPIIHVMYSVSPRHTDEYYVEKAREAAALNPYRLCFKDVGGLLTPERASDLLPRMLAVTPGVEWEFHGHCNNGLGPLNALAAVDAGVNYVHTAIPPLANGSSQPSVFNVARNLRARGYDPVVDLDALGPVSEHLTYVAKREGLPMGVPREFDERLYGHQIPGGMISNMEYQLELAGVHDRLEETLEETASVRADFGYPIMVTPLSQFVGTQAAINVIVGERYKEVPDSSIEYALGRHGGQEAIDAMDPDVRTQILNRPRAQELSRTEPPEPTLRELRQRFGNGISDEDLILRTVVGDDALDVIEHDRDHNEYLSTRQPLVQLVRELTNHMERRSVLISKGDLSLSLSMDPPGREGV